MFFSKSTQGFYDPVIHGNSIPSDAVEITEEQYAALFAGQGAGKRIVADDRGFPVLSDPPSATASEMWERISAERDRRTDQGGYKVGSKWFHSDQISRAQQLCNAMLGNSLPETQWKTMDGTFVTMTPALAAQVLSASAASDRAIFAAAESHKAVMEASADPSKYDFSGGWPAAFQDEQS